MDIFKNDVRDYAVATYETVRETLKSCWQFTRDAWVLILLLLTAVGVAILLAKPAPPFRHWLNDPSKRSLWPSANIARH